MPLKLVVISGPDFGAEFAVKAGTYFLGSGPSADIRLSDTSVSRHHLTLRVRPDCLELVDNESRNGSYCEGLRFTSLEARAGTEVRIGRTVMRVAPASEAISRLKPSAESQFGELVGKSIRMRELFAQLERISGAGTDVLITGETGSGKDVCARSIHARSARAQAPFVAVDFAGLTPSLLESELFGHVRGAFTGATADRAGVFEVAHGGTLLLDEIGELRLELQPRLLRVLETRTVRRVGGNQDRKVDVRILSATHRDLEAEVRAGRFRADLYHRIAAVTVKLPALRERLEDLPLLVAQLLRKLGRDDHALGPETLALFHDHDWPGNVRELKNVVERAVGLGVPALPAAPRRVRKPRPSSKGSAGRADLGAFKEVKERLVDSFERDYLHNLLEGAQGNLQRAAAQAGISRVYLYRLLAKHRLGPGAPGFRRGQRP